MIDPKLANPGPASKKAFRVSAGSLLLAERKTKKDLQAAVDDEAMRAAGEAGQRKKIERAALLTVIVLASKRLTQTLNEKLRAARLNARDLAAKRLAVELRATGATKAALQVRAQQLSHVDEIHAASSAESLATQWRSRTLHAATRALRRNEDVVRALAQSGPAMAGSVYRTAATENAQAYNEGRQDASKGIEIRTGAFVRKIDGDEDETGGVDDVVAGLFGRGDDGGGGVDDPAGGPGDYILVDRFDAILDKATCSECSALDGTLTHLGEEFPGGAEPGYVHILCRCVRTVLAVPFGSVDLAA